MEQIDAYGRSVTLIHFVYQNAPERIACMPNLREFHLTPFHPAYQRTNSTAATTCPACKKTDAYKVKKNEGF